MKNMNINFNNADQTSAMIQIAFQLGEKIGKMETKIDGICKENGELKEGIAKMVNAFEELKTVNEGFKKEIGKLSEENNKLKEEIAGKARQIDEMTICDGNGNNKKVKKLQNNFNEFPKTWIKKNINGYSNKYLIFKINFWDKYDFLKDIFFRNLMEVIKRLKKQNNFNDFPKEMDEITLINDSKITSNI